MAAESSTSSLPFRSTRTIPTTVLLALTVGLVVGMVGILLAAAPAADAQHRAQQSGKRMPGARNGGAKRIWHQQCIRLTPHAVRRLPAQIRQRCSPHRARAVRRGQLIFTPHASGNMPVSSVRWSGKVVATWYGPGFYGRRTGCGSRLRTSTWGVAHRTLPCGTMVVVGHGRRSVAVPVVDRGPFSGATIDLTGRVKTYLGFSGAGAVRFGTMPAHRVALSRL